MNIKQQRGMTLTGIIFTVFLVGFALTIAFKMVPHYLDNNVIQGAIDQVGATGVNEQTELGIRRKLSDFFIINNIRDIDTKDVKLVRTSRGTKIMLDYEKRVELFGNVDVVMKFHNEYDSATAPQ